MSDTPFEIRTAQTEDQPQLLELVERAAARLCAKLGEPRQQAEWVEKQKLLFSQRMQDPQSEVLVAASPYGIVGCVYLQQGGTKAESHGCDAYLGGLYSGVRGLGIGMALNREALICAAGRGAGSVYARLPKANKAAVRALEELGFRRGGEEKSQTLPQSVWVGLEMQLLHGALDPSILPAKRTEKPAPPAS